MRVVGHRLLIGCSCLLKLTDPMVATVLLMSPMTHPSSCSPNSIPAHFNLKPVAKETLRIDRVAMCAHEHISCR